MPGLARVGVINSPRTSRVSRIALAGRVTGSLRVKCCRLTDYELPATGWFKNDNRDGGRDSGTQEQEIRTWIAGSFQRTSR